MATIEFAIVLPLLLSLLLGAGDLAPSTMARFKAANAAQSLADLITQSSMVQTSDVVSAYQGAASVLLPFPTTNMLLRVTNIVSDGNGHAFVYWSCGQGTMTPLTAKSAVTKLSNGDPVTNVLYNVANTSYIVVDAQYTYTAPAQFLLTSPQVMSFTAYMLPRGSSYVGFPWNGNASTPPTAPTSTSNLGTTTLSNSAVCNYAY